MGDTLQVKRPDQQYQSTEGDAIKDNQTTQTTKIKKNAYTIIQNKKAVLSQGIRAMPL